MYVCFLFCLVSRLVLGFQGSGCAFLRVFPWLPLDDCLQLCMGVLSGCVLAYFMFFLWMLLALSVVRILYFSSCLIWLPLEDCLGLCICVLFTVLSFSVLSYFVVNTEGS